MFTSNKIDEKWFKDLLEKDDYSDEDSEVQLVRTIFNRQYLNYWIDTMGSESHNRSGGFTEFNVELWPKTINLKEELKKNNITLPPPFTLSYPISLKRTDEEEEALIHEEWKVDDEKKLPFGTTTSIRFKREQRYMVHYFIEKKNHKKACKKYKKIVYQLIHEDINQQKKLKHFSTNKFRFLKCIDNNKKITYTVFNN